MILCVLVRTGWCSDVLEPHISAFCFSLLSLLAAATVSCLYHTVPEALKLSTLWEPRYSSSRKASLCGPLKFVWTATFYIRVCAVFAMGVGVGVCGSEGLFVCWHATFQFSFFILRALSACCCCCCIMSSASHRASR